MTGRILRNLIKISVLTVIVISLFAFEALAKTREENNTGDAALPVASPVESQICSDPLGSGENVYTVNTGGSTGYINSLNYRTTGVEGGISDSMVETWFLIDSENPVSFSLAFVPMKYSITDSGKDISTDYDYLNGCVSFSKNGITLKNALQTGGEYVFDTGFIGESETIVLSDSISTNEWHKLRCEWDLESCELRIYYDDKAFTAKLNPHLKSEKRGLKRFSLYMKSKNSLYMKNVRVRTAYVNSTDAEKEWVFENQYSIDTLSDIFAYKISGAEASIEGFKCNRIPEGNEITIPGEIGGCKVTKIGAYAFSKDENGFIKYGRHERYKSLEKIEILAELESIGDGAFNSLTSLKSVNVPQTVKSIGQMAFAHTESLSEINLSEGLLSLGISAFRGSGLEYVVIPSSVTKLSQGLFYDCSKLKGVAFLSDSLNTETSVESFGGEINTGCVLSAYPSVLKKLSNSGGKKLRYSTLMHFEGKGGNKAYCFENGTLVCGYYSDSDRKKLTGAEVINAKSGEAYSFSSGTDVKLFFLDSLSNIKPIGDYYYEVDKTSLMYRTDKAPVKSRPRVYFTGNDVEALKDKLYLEENRTMLERLTSDVEMPDKYDFEKDEKFPTSVSRAIESKAFYYALYGDAAVGEQAVKLLFDLMASSKYIFADYNKTGQTIYLCGIVYDWCNDLLSEEQKLSMQKNVKLLAFKSEVSWPPRYSVVAGHSLESNLLRDLYVAAIAMYGDSNEIYQNVAGRFFKYYVPSIKFLYDGGYPLCGFDYLGYRYQWLPLASKLTEAAFGEENIFGTNTTNAMYSLMYARRPDGLYLRSGDNKFDNSYSGYYKSTDKRGMMYSAVESADPILAYQMRKENFETTPEDGEEANFRIGPAEYFVMMNHDVGNMSQRVLPLTRYFGSPSGTMIARTSWDDGINSDTVLVEMKVGKYMFGEHQHPDAGAFQIYYKGALANDTGYYMAADYGMTTRYQGNNGNTAAYSAHSSNYQSRTIAHNCMLVYDPDEVFAPVVSQIEYEIENDGGQRTDLGYPGYIMSETEMEKWHVANVEAYEYGPDEIEPEYSYIKGDIKNAYSKKVEEYERSFAFLNLKNEDVPAALVVFDRIKASDASFRKTWLLHTKNEPALSGNRAVATVTDNMYNGRLTLDCLLPEADNTQINVITGGETDAWVNGTNYYANILPGRSNEGGGSRLEISPLEKSQTDYFLNVMQISNADGGEVPKAEKIETATHVGAVVADRIVLFGKAADCSKTGEDIKLEIPRGKTYRVMIADCKEGTWTIYDAVSGKEVMHISANAEGRVLNFEALGGSYNIVYTSGDITKPIPNPDARNYAKSDIFTTLRYENKFVYLDSVPVFSGGMPYIAADEILGFAALEHQISESNITVVKSDITYTLQNESKIVSYDSSSHSMTYPAVRVIDSKPWISAEAMAYITGKEWKYDRYSDMIYIQ